MKKNEILKVLDSWNLWNYNIKTGISRTYYSNKILSLIKDSKIDVVIETGIRRAGKSFIARQVAKALVDDGFKKEQILIINLEDERLIELNYQLLLDIYHTYKEKINPDKNSVIIIDEAQEVEKWEHFVRGISERGESKFIVTGSSSKLLDSEYSTLLSGREVLVYIHTLNLLEYTNFIEETAKKDHTKVKFNQKRLNPKESNLNLFSDIITIRWRYISRYILEGGFPAITLSENKAILARSYFETIIQKDVIQRHNIRRQDELIRLSKYYITSVGSRVTFNSVSKFLKIPVKTAYNFSHYLEESYLIFLVDKFSYSIKSQDNSPKKVYCIDNAFPAMLGINPIEIEGRLLENAIASTLYLISRHSDDFHFYYWYEDNKEVDFVIKEEHKYRIVQVAYSIDSDKTRTREISAIMSCAAKLNLYEAEIVTLGFDKEELINGVRISYISAQEWIDKELTSYGLV